MYHRLILSLPAVLMTADFATSGNPLAVAQQPAPGHAQSLVQVLMSDRTGPDEYAAVSRELVARGAEAVPLLVGHLPSSDERAKLRILGTLAQIGPASAPALPEVRRLLREGSPFVRAASADCIRALGQAGRESLPDLFPALDDPDEITVGTAARAIGTLDPAFISTRLTDLLDRLGTSPASVDQLSLRIWHRVACRSVTDAVLARDLRHWLFVVRFMGQDDQRVGDALGWWRS
jgi:hypothetical protein